MSALLVAVWCKDGGDDHSKLSRQHVKPPKGQGTEMCELGSAACGYLPRKASLIRDGEDPARSQHG